MRLVDPPPHSNDKLLSEFIVHPLFNISSHGCKVMQLLHSCKDTSLSYFLLVGNSQRGVEVEELLDKSLSIIGVFFYEFVESAIEFVHVFVFD